MTPPVESRIDFKEILDSVIWEMQEGFPDRTDKDCILRGLNEAAMMVEEQTIQRCAEDCKSTQGMIDDGCDFICSADEGIRRIERLYSSSTSERPADQAKAQDGGNNA